MSGPTQNLGPISSAVLTLVEYKMTDKQIIIYRGNFNQKKIQFLENKDNFPVNLKFGRAKITTNEKIVLASMFYPLYALAVQLSPEQVGWGNIKTCRLYQYDKFVQNIDDIEPSENLVFDLYFMVI